MPKQETNNSFYIKKKGFGEPSSSIKNLDGQRIFGGDFRVLVSNSTFNKLPKDLVQFTDEHQEALKKMYDGHPRFRKYIGCKNYNYKAPYEDMMTESLAVSNK